MTSRFEGRGFFGIKLDYNNRSKKTLEKYGHQNIKSLRISRKPLVKAITNALNFVTRGYSGKLYDDLFHLSLIAEMDEQDVIIEKLETVNISDEYEMMGARELKHVPMKGKVITLNELMQNTLNVMGPEKFFDYNAWKNNCQVFVDQLLKNSGLWSQDLHDFLFQNMEEVVKKTPWIAQKIANFATHSASWWNKISGGKEPIFLEDIERSSMENDYFRKVLYTAPNKNLQLVLMSLKPKERIGKEMHNKVNQFFRVEHGTGKIYFGDTSRNIKSGDAILIPAGLEHDLENTSDSDSMKLYTLYAPSQHPPNAREKNKK